MTNAGYNPQEIFEGRELTIFDVNKFKDFVFTHTNYFGERPGKVDEGFYAAMDIFGSLN